MVRALSVLLVLLCTACGLAEDDRDEDNKYIYLDFYDKAFEAYCLEKFDTNGDGRISRYEAQRVRRMSCPGRGIASLTDIREFFNLRELDCSGNDLTRLDLTACTYLERLDCRDNALVSLDLDGVRGLVWMDCSGNDLPRLDGLAADARLSGKRPHDARRGFVRRQPEGRCAQQSRSDDGLLPRIAEHLLRRTDRTHPPARRVLERGRPVFPLSIRLCARPLRGGF